MLKIELLEELVDVFDITVEDNHNFYANGILVHNCEIMLPTESFETVEDAGYLIIEHNGQDITIPNTAVVRLTDGTEKLVRHVTEDDDVVAFIFEDGKQLLID
jgi:hypothetical protein